MGYERSYAVQRAQHLPTPPQLALQLMELVGRPDLEVRELGEVLRRDPLLSLRLLALARQRSPGCGVDHVEAAIEEVGLAAAKVVALGFNLVQEESLSFDLITLYRRAHACAVFARELSAYACPADQHFAYTAGLLSAIGEASCRWAWPEEFGSLDERVRQEGIGLRQAERELFGFDHRDISAELFRTHGIPERFVEQLSLGDGEGPEVDHRARLMRAARRLQAHEERHPGEAPGDELRRVTGEFVDPLEGVERFLPRVHAGIQRDSRLFLTDGVDAQTLREMRSVAPQLLLRISLDTTATLDEVERRTSEARERRSLLQQDHYRLVDLATRDGLTGLANRFELDRRLTREMRRARRQALSFAVVMVDLDHFKSVNDTHGHAAGDEVLRRVGALLQQHAGKDEVIGRYGGEEFCWAMVNVGALTVQRRTEDLRSAIERLQIPIQDPEGTTTVLRPTASLGAAWRALVPRQCQIEDFRERADQKLYEAKHHGRNQVVIDLPAGQSLRLV